MHNKKLFLLHFAEGNDLLPLKASISVIMGDQEKHVDEIDNWQRFSQIPTNAKIYPGGHFFIHKNARELAAHIKTWTNKCFVPTYSPQPAPF